MNNSISIVGHVGKVPVKTTLQSGKTVAEFTVAVQEYGQKDPLWFDIKSWNGNGDRVMETITKGREVAIQGRLSFNTHNGVMRPVITMFSFHLCGKKPADPQAAPATQASQVAETAE